MKKKILIVLTLLLIVISIIISNLPKSEVKAIDEDVEPIEKEEVPTNYKVDIKGAINKPGVYEVTSDKRVIDVIQLAGGLKKDANTNYINLSAKVTDEMVIWIYTKEEIKEFKLEQSSTKYMLQECNCPKVDNTTCLNNDNNTSSNSNEIVNINTASKEALMTLDGIGEAKADSIIEYREKNGPFTTIEDIMKVNGIGESAFAKIKDRIKV